MGNFFEVLYYFISCYLLLFLLSCYPQLSLVFHSHYLGFVRGNLSCLISLPSSEQLSFKDCFHQFRKQIGSSFPLVTALISLCCFLIMAGVLLPEETLIQPKFSISVSSPIFLHFSYAHQKANLIDGGKLLLEGDVYFQSPNYLAI